MGWDDTDTDDGLTETQARKRYEVVDRIKTLEAERDSILEGSKIELRNHQNAMAVVCKEIDRLKAELETAKAESDISDALLEDQKSRSEKLAEALRKIEIGKNKKRSTGMDTPPIAVSRDQLRLWAKAALEEYEK